MCLRNVVVLYLISLGRYFIYY